MKLKIEEYGQEKTIDVKFWSLVKCMVLVDLALMGIFYGILFIFLVVYTVASGVIW